MSTIASAASAGRSTPNTRSASTTSSTVKPIIATIGPITMRASRPCCSWAVVVHTGADTPSCYGDRSATARSARSSWCPPVVVRSRRALFAGADAHDRRRRSCTHTLPSPILPVRAAVGDRVDDARRRRRRRRRSRASPWARSRSGTRCRGRSRCGRPGGRSRCTSVTVMPTTPAALSAALTSSSLNGLMIAVMSFTSFSGSFVVGQRAVSGTRSRRARRGRGRWPRSRRRHADADRRS